MNFDLNAFFGNVTDIGQAHTGIKERLLEMIGGLKEQDLGLLAINHEHALLAAVAGMNMTQIEELSRARDKTHAGTTVKLTWKNVKNIPAAHLETEDDFL